jgi:hypothetical protein
MSATVYFLPKGDPQGPSDQVVENSKKKILCPTAAIQTDHEKTYVWIVVGEDQTRRVEIEIDSEKDGRTEVISGLSGGERVILNPTLATAEAKFIRIVDDKTT